MTATKTPTTPCTQADRKAVESLLRDVAFVLRMTQKVKRDLFADVPAVADRATAGLAVAR